MTCTEILGEIQRLPIQQQFELQQTLFRLLQDQESALAVPRSNPAGVSAAAHALLDDYKTDPELTAFTALDSDDFHATR
jgi:hypothetical protein